MHPSLNLKRHVAVLALATTLAFFSTAVQAHGSTKPAHGGLVQMSGETLFELTVGPDAVALYVKEDDEDLPSADMSAKLSISYKGAKTEVTLAPAAGNKFEAKGLKIASGSKVGVLLVKKATQSKVSANFSVD